MRAELLAPAGDMECLKTAFRFGADAVYLGGSFMQLRSSNVGFTNETLEEAVSYAHSLNKKVYVTVNSFANNQEIPLLPDYGRFLSSIGADAAIVSDLGAMAALKDGSPDLEIHISTQANCQNYRTAQCYYDFGASRVVLGRELSLEEIREIREKTPKKLELEAFVHGAMCMSYSGRCMISTFLTGRSGNRGACTQPCRWQYHLVEQTRPNVFIPVEESEKGTAILSSMDLNCLDFLDQIEGAGISSFKIEGRMKTPYYVATVVNAYRMAMDKKAPLEFLQSELNCASHRPYSTGFYFGAMKKPEPNDGAYHQDCQFVGVVKEQGEGFIWVEQRNRFCVGDRLEVLTPGKLNVNFLVDSMEDEWGNSVDSAPHAQQLLKIYTDVKVESGDLLRLRKTNKE